MDLRLAIICLLTASFFPCESYRILCLFPFHGKSHYIMFAALCRGLARRGHQVDVISHYPLENPPPNYTDLLDLNGTLEKVTGSFTLDDVEALHGHSIVKELSTKYGNSICEVLASEKMQEFVRNPPKTRYDIILTEYFASRCFLAFGVLLNAPVATVVSALEAPYLDELIANPLSSATYPNYFMEIAALTTFYDRLLNTLQNILYPRLFFHYTAVQADMVKRYMGLELGDLEEIEKKIALTLVNTHHSMFGVRATVPGLVEVGGLHVEMDQSKMPSDLERWLDESSNGVVYFSLGSLVRFECLPESTVRHLYASLGKITPVRVLLKVVDKKKLPSGLPKNVLALPWIPQIPVLRHRNTRVFVTHGGLMGSQEALYHGVPVIGIPLFADQMHNVDIFVRKGLGLKLDYRYLTEEAMDAALNALLSNSSYKKTALKESGRYKDRPMSALDTAIFWIEYVIRNGPASLRSPAVDMPWWQTTLLDVYLFLLASVAFILYLLVVLVRICARIFRGAFARGADPRKKRD